MGNTGSAHNLHNECVDSEINSYYTQQYLRRTRVDTNNKHNQVILGGWSRGSNLTECKVLPKPTENLKLRATTNGAILQAGGTISFRAKEQLDDRTDTSGLERENGHIAAFQPMRRCNTLILDDQNDSQSLRKSTLPIAEFRRTQTLLHVGYNRTKSQENISTNLDDSKNRHAQPVSNTASTIKVNKYNKKHKAPPAPMKINSGIDPTNTGKNIPVDPKNSSLSKPRLYTTNSNKTLVQQQPEQHTTPIQRGTNTRTSINTSRPAHHTNLGYASKLPYRREKSFDAVLLRHKENCEHDTDGRWASMQKSNMLKKRELPTQLLSRKSEDNSQINVGETVTEKKNLTMQHVKITSNKMHCTSTNTYCSDKNYPLEITKIEERTRPEESSHFNLNNSNRILKMKDGTDCLGSLNERKTKTQQSRIPQLKRTFYFGMKKTNKNLNPEILQTEKVLISNEEKSEKNDRIVKLNHNIEVEDEEIVDNGILIHVRPTLPRRQPETPTFSPAAAWRNLLDEQQRLQHDRSKPIHKVQNSRSIESPICLSTDPKENSLLLSTANWTPQQDLEDDDEERGELEQKYKTNKLSDKINIENHKHSNSTNPLEIFSLSLPRDVHLQCHMRTSMNITEQKNSLKAGNCWLVPGFNSLQKFKTHLSKNIVDSRSSKCTCDAKVIKKRNSYHLQTIFGDSFSTDLKSHQPDCDLYKTATTKSTSYHNDNWVLHKSKTNDTNLSTVAKMSDDYCFKSSMTMHSLAHLQPKSLTYVCGGKHIVYLPRQNAFNNLNKDNSKSNAKQTKTSKTTYKRRQQQDMARESLQDLKPIQNMNQSNVGMSEKNTHRFSFQSTVRVLEKRRLAEKLSKDAEIQEAQRLNELEAMKRVEEDFQRKRAPEKAKLRNQLRLHLKAYTDNEEYRSLPLNINDRDKKHNFQLQSQHISDVNNNLHCRAEPDGAASPSPNFNDNLDKLRHSNFPLTYTNNSKELERFDSDGEESETQIPDLRCTALLIEPYLHSII